MLKVLRQIFLGLCVGFFVFAMASMGLSAISRSHRSDFAKELELFVEAMDFVQTCYVAEAKPKDLVYGAIGGMVGGLDPHSQFLTPEEYAELKIDTQGKFGGVGVEITLKDDLITVIAAIEDTPAARAGIRTHDRIVKIDGVVAKNVALADAVKRLRGKPGTVVTIVVWRQKEGKLYSFKIKRAIIDVKDVKAVRIIEDHIGYVRLVNFSDQAADELDQALKTLREKGADRLVIDVRNNPGGVFDEAVAVAERFLAKGLAVVSVKSREAKESEVFSAGFRSPILEMPLVLLVNEGSASGSEILAGAFQDHKRALIVGTKTFGKGSVQSVLELRDGSAIKLTTARYLTPLGRSIHEKGIEPDVVVEKDGEAGAAPKKDTADAEKILENVECQVPESSETIEGEFREPDVTTDPQLRRAVEVIKQIRKGGGVSSGWAM